MLFSLDIRRARKGDCLLLHYGSKADPKLMIIDGGPSKVYKPFLKPRLNQIREERGIAARKPLPVELLMVSHVDDDHIRGILELTKEMGEAKRSRRPQSYKIKTIWHNSFDDVIGNRPADLTASLEAAYGAASAEGEIDVDEEVIGPDFAKVLASVGQGHRLRTDTKFLKIPLNRPFDQLVIASAPGRGGKVKTIPFGDMSFTVIGPMRPELEALQKKHDKWLTDSGRGRKPEDELAAYDDKSAANLSSLVVLAEAGGRSILLTGDARGDKVLDGLELTGLVEPGGTLKVDVLKMPHHGSDRNVDIDFFQRIKAKHYVFSGDGEHGNPERATLKMLFDHHGKEHMKLWLTYPVEVIDEERKHEHEKLRKRKPGPAWSRAKHSLAAFFEKQKAAGASFEIKVVDSVDGAVIDLGNEKLGF